MAGDESTVDRRQPGRHVTLLRVGPEDAADPARGERPARHRRPDHGARTPAEIGLLLESRGPCVHGERGDVVSPQRALEGSELASEHVPQLAGEVRQFTGRRRARSQLKARGQRLASVVQPPEQHERQVQPSGRAERESKRRAPARSDRPPAPPGDDEDADEHRHLRQRRTPRVESSSGHDALPEPTQLPDGPGEDRVDPSRVPLLNERRIRPRNERQPGAEDRRQSGPPPTRHDRRPRLPLGRRGRRRSAVGRGSRRRGRCHLSCSQYSSGMSWAIFRAPFAPP